jgi:ketosteroid isomerase-like protein
LSGRSNANNSSDVIELSGPGAEHDRFAAMVRGDLTALDTLVADDLGYTHTDGVTQTKAEFLETVRSHVDVVIRRGRRLVCARWQSTRLQP